MAQIQSASSLPRIAIHGAAGRMGRQLLAAASERSDLTIGAAIELAGTPSIGLEVGVLSAEVQNDSGGRVTVVDDVTAVLDDFDVLIDFTRPDSSQLMLSRMVAAGKPMVIGTTGFSEAQKLQIVQAAESIPVLFAPNFSVGVTLALNILATTAAALGDEYDVEIIEAHHRNKIDAPSGTALAMGESVAQALGRDLSTCAIYGREGNTGVRERNTIGFETIRGGDIIGEHTVLFAGMGERIEITHKATDRMTFARGAIRAAHWLFGKSSDLYDMTDVIGLAAQQKEKNNG